jgi:hypothetical protein
VTWQAVAQLAVEHFLLMVDFVVGAGVTVLMYLAYARLSPWPPRRKRRAPQALPAE